MARKKKLTEAEKWQRKADRKNQREAEAFPLFAEQEAPVTAAELYARWRVNKALAGVGGGAGSIEAEILECFRYHELRRLARAHLAPGDFARLDARILETWPSVGYWNGVWVDVLTGKRRLACSLRLEFDPGRVTRYNPDGRRLIEEDVLPPEDWAPPFTREQLAARFAPPPYEQPDAAKWQELLEMITRRPLSTPSIPLR